MGDRPTVSNAEVAVTAHVWLWPLLHVADQFKDRPVTLVLRRGIDVSGLAEVFHQPLDIRLVHPDQILPTVQGIWLAHQFEHTTQHVVIALVSEDDLRRESNQQALNAIGSQRIQDILLIRFSEYSQAGTSRPGVIQRLQASRTFHMLRSAVLRQLSSWGAFGHGLRVFIHRILTAFTTLFFGDQQRSGGDQNVLRFGPFDESKPEVLRRYTTYVTGLQRTVILDCFSNAEVHEDQRPFRNDANSGVPRGIEPAAPQFFGAVADEILSMAYSDRDVILLTTRGLQKRELYAYYREYPQRIVVVPDGSSQQALGVARALRLSGKKVFWVQTRQDFTHIQARLSADMHQEVDHHIVSVLLPDTSSVQAVPIDIGFIEQTELYYPRDELTMRESLRRALGSEGLKQTLVVAPPLPWQESIPALERYRGWDMLQRGSDKQTLVVCLTRVDLLRTALAELPQNFAEPTVLMPLQTLPMPDFDDAYLRGFKQLLVMSASNVSATLAAFYRDHMQALLPETKVHQLHLSPESSPQDWAASLANLADLLGIRADSLHLSGTE